MTALAPADLETALVTHLNTVRAAVTYATRIENPRPTRYCRITRAGGGGRNLVQSDVRILLEVFGPDETQAFQDAQMTYAHLWAAQDSYITDVYVTQIELNEPVNFPDPDTSDARFQFLASFTTSLTEVNT